MGSTLSIPEFKRIRRQHGLKVAEAANRGEYPHLVQQIRTPLRVSDPDSEEVERPPRQERPARPSVERTTHPFMDRPKPVPTEEVPEVPEKETIVEAPKPSRPILNPIQARFAAIAWNAQRQLRRSPTKAELEVIREKIFFGGNFFGAMSALERLGAVARDDDGDSIRYRVHEPRMAALQPGDHKIVRAAVTGVT
ncbi:MAG: hypothetical protein WCO25_06330, partial [Candidatus Uhrbacteria bacterium]